MLSQEELRLKIQEIVARECSVYSDAPIESGRCVGAAAQILWLLEDYAVKK